MVREIKAVAVEIPTVTASIGTAPQASAKFDDIKVVDRPGLPQGGKPGDILAKNSGGDYDAVWVTPASSAEADNTRPITAAAVYTEIGNINALLATI